MGGIEPIKAYLLNRYVLTKWSYFRIAEVKNAVNVDNFKEDLSELEKQKFIRFKPGIHGVLVELLVK